MTPMVTAQNEQRPRRIVQLLRWRRVDLAAHRVTDDASRICAVQALRLPRPARAIFGGRLDAAAHRGRAKGDRGLERASQQRMMKFQSRRGTGKLQEQ